MDSLPCIKPCHLTSLGLSCQDENPCEICKEWMKGALTYIPEGLSYREEEEWINAQSTVGMRLIPPPVLEEQEDLVWGILDTGNILDTEDIHPLTLASIEMLEKHGTRGNEN